MEVILALVWLALFVWGVIGLFKPWFVGLPSRWVALSLGTFSFAPVALATEFFPVEGEKATPGATLGFLMMWGFIAVLVIFLRIGFRAYVLTKDDNPRLRTNSFVERRAMRWATAAKRQRSRLKESVLPQHFVPHPSDAAPVIEPVEFPAVQAVVREKKVTPGLPKKRMPRVPVEEIGDVTRPIRDHSSGWAGFIVYTDAKGEISERRIVVKRIEGYGRAETVFAWCCERSAYRRFLIGKISELIDVETGEVLDPQMHFNQLANEGAIGTTDKSLADLVTILVFLARCDGEAHSVEMDVVEDAILNHVMRFGGDPKLAQKTARNARRLAPDADDFLAALVRIGKHPDRALLATMILDAAADVMAADGRMATEELHWFLPVSEALEDMAAA